MNEFLEFFDNKIRRITSTFCVDQATVTDDILVIAERLSSFQVVSDASVGDVLKNTKFTYCACDPMPMGLIVSGEMFGQLVSITTDMINLSVSSGVFPKSE